MVTTDHSTFSQNRKRRFNDSDVFRELFNEIVRVCIEKRLASGEKVACDGSFIPANVAWSSRVELDEITEKSTYTYLEILDQELQQQPGYQEGNPIQKKQRSVRSKTDRDCRYINHGKKKGLGYLLEASVDCQHGIVTGVDVFPGNRKESDIILQHLERQMSQTGLRIGSLALDRGYDVGAVHRGLEILGIQGYCAPLQFSNTPQSMGFSYCESEDCFICPEGATLSYKQIAFRKPTQNYLRFYSCDKDTCQSCPIAHQCLHGEKSRRI